MKAQSLLAASAFLAPLTAWASTFSPARPPSIPLAVKSPYLSISLPVGAERGGGGLLTADWARFWQGAIAGWVGLVRIDGTPYCWMGLCSSVSDQVAAMQGLPAATQDAFEYTATRSIFSFSTQEGVGFNVTFLTGIYPEDYGRQSVTSTYLNVDVFSLDGQEHDVQIYTDISGEVCDPDPNTPISWSSDDSEDGSVFSHTVHRQTQLLFTEDTPYNGSMALWGDWLYSTGQERGFSWQTGPDRDVRGQFLEQGNLTGQGDAQFRSINDNWPVFALAHDLGSVGSEGASALWTIGLFQEQAIQYEGESGYEPLSAYWTTYCPSPIECTSSFYHAFDDAAALMTQTDQRIQTDSVDKGGQDLATITTLAYRQAYGGIQLVSRFGSLGNTTVTEGNQEPYIFLKEISSDGNVQTVDVIFPAFPVFQYDNPTLVKFMLDALFENQEQNYYPNAWAMHDLGTSYPNATGQNTGKDECMSVEEPGNMLIMTLAYDQASGDDTHTYLRQHYDILKQWNGYLINAALAPQGADSLSTDDFEGKAENQTDLALKGIIGIRAMAVIANLTGNMEDGVNYTAISQTYLDQWQKLGFNMDANPPHSTLTYGEQDSHGLLYNLLGDKILKLDFVPQSVYDIQSQFYPTIGTEYGISLDTRNPWAKLDWQIWAGAACTRATLDFITERIVHWINTTPTNAPLTDLYDTDSGDFPIGAPKFAYRPVVGGVFAALIV